MTIECFVLCNGRIHIDPYDFAYFAAQQLQIHNEGACLPFQKSAATGADVQDYEVWLDEHIDSSKELY